MKSSSEIESWIHPAGDRIGSHRSALILGAGLHQHLRTQTKNSDETKWKPFTDWLGLIAAMELELEVPASQISDPIARWEELVAQLSRKSSTRVSAKVVDNQALRGLAKRLAVIPEGAERTLQKFGRAVLTSNFTDIISFNYDPMFHQAMCSAGAVVVDPDIYEDLTVFQYAGRLIRYWQAHGRIENPTEIRIGSRSYAKSVTRLEGARKLFKRRQRHWLETNSPNRLWTASAFADWFASYFDNSPKGTADVRHWVDVFLTHELIFIGCSLQPVEHDVWWLLHQRRRNMLGIQAIDKARTMIVLKDPMDSKYKHLHHSPAGLEVIAYSKWADAWNDVLGK